MLGARGSGLGARGSGLGKTGGTASASRPSLTPMRLIPLRALLCGTAAVAVSVVLASLTPSRAQPRQAIEPGNVNRLTVAWTYDTRDSTAPVRPGRKSPAFEATPVYADGQLYLSTPYGTVVALDADTGKEVWRTDLADPPRRQLQRVHRSRPGARRRSPLRRHRRRQARLPRAPRWHTSVRDSDTTARSI